MAVVELARFQVVEGAEERLLAERPAMLAALRARFPGVLAAYLTREPDGGWLDILVWRGHEEAEESAREIMTIPECAAWFRHVSESGGVRHVEVMSHWPE